MLTAWLPLNQRLFAAGKVFAQTQGKCMVCNCLDGSGW